MTDKEFCRIESALTGEPIDKVEQLVSTTMTGRELKEYLEDAMELVKSDLLHNVSDCNHKVYVMELDKNNVKYLKCDNCGYETYGH